MSELEKRNYLVTEHRPDRGPTRHGNHLVVSKIENKLLRLNAVPFMMRAFIERILDFAKDEQYMNMNSEYDLLNTIDTLEITYTILCNHEMPILRGILQDNFQLESMFEIFQGISQQINEICRAIENDTESTLNLHEKFNTVLVGIYIQLYFNPKFSDIGIHELRDKFVENIGNKY